MHIEESNHFSAGKVRGFQSENVLSAAWVRITMKVV